MQGGFPIIDRPFSKMADQIRGNLKEQELILRVEAMLDDGALSRFGPMYNAEEMGGAFCLCAMSVPPEIFDEVAEQVNAFEEVAHNYEREHRLNMWFVLATEHPDQIRQAAREIEGETGLKVYLFPKHEEFFIGLKVTA